MGATRWPRLVVCLILLGGSTARAEKPEIPALPAVLDPELRHRKKHQIELALFGGTYTGPSLRKSWITGARSYFHLSNMFAVGGSYGFSRHAVNHYAGPSSQLEQRNTHYLSAEGAMSTDVAMRVGRSLLELDLYMTLGVGARQLDGDWGPLGVIGGGVKLYTGLSWLAVRIDVNNYLHRVGGAVDMDISFAANVAFLFPPNPSPFER
jgi:hypothetical protein